MKKKGKGLSFDQKRERMLGIFHKTKDVFNYQEIEKLSIKAGIPFPNVKDILNSLKADGLVQCQKIGAGVFYWSFPSRAYQTMKQRLQATEKMITSLLQQNEKLITETNQGKQQREEGEKRQEMMVEVAQMRQEYKELEHQIQKYIRFDPQRYQTLIKQNREIATKINEEIDNLEQIKKFIKKNQIGVKDDEIEQCYEIPVEMEEEFV